MEVSKILIPVDFKDEPGVIYEYISSTGHAHPKIEFTFLHIAEFPVIPGNYVEPMDYLGEFYQRHLHEINRKMKTLVDSPWFHDLNIRHEVVTDSVRGTGEEIAAYAEKGCYDLLLLYSRHRRGIQNLFSGSELLRIVRLCQVPMIIFSPERLSRFHRIAFATDLSPESAEVFLHLQPVAELLGGRILCFHVNTRSDFKTQRQFIEERNVFINRIGVMQGVEVAVYNAEDLTSGIIQFTEDNVANFIAVATHNRKGISRFYYGSATEDLIKSTTYPIIVLNRFKAGPKKGNPSARNSQGVFSEE